MQLRPILHPHRWQYGAALLLVSLIAIGCLAFSMEGSDSYESSRREILLRRVGHELLLQSGDSTSRVLPVKKMAGNEYRVGFENPFSFGPDSLLQTTRRLLANNSLTNNYVVNVLNCADSSVAYGFAVSGNGKDDIITCRGRIQPKACYLLSITFQPTATGTAKTGYLLGGLALLAVVGFAFLRRTKPQPVLAEEQPAMSMDAPANFQPPSTSVFMLGDTTFDAEARKLVLADQTIELTKTEARVLRIFAAAPNEAIERSRLQKEIWEDEGVIVGRSLDMFISKLRKKLEPDPTIRLAVIRGKGYRLEVSAQANSLLSNGGA